MLRAFAVLILVCACGALGPARAADAPEAAPGAPPGAHGRSYLIVPPENLSENRELYWLGEALLEGMERYMSWAGAEVATREERRSIEGDEMGLGPLSVPTIATRIKEAEELEVAKLVSGSFATSGETSRLATVTFSVLDVRQARRSSPAVVGPLPLDDLPSLQRAVGTKLLQIESLPLPGPDLPTPPASEADAPAYEARIKALLEEDPEKRSKYLLRAVEVDPDYFRARLDLAILQREAGEPGKALATLRAKPFRGDPTLSAQAERIAGEINLEAGDLTPAIEALRRSLSLKDDCSTHLTLARALIGRGDFQVAAAELELARRLDPQDPEIAEVQALLPPPTPPE